jgi:hypothetical protein
MQNKKRTTPGIPTWSIIVIPTMFLSGRETGSGVLTLILFPGVLMLEVPPLPQIGLNRLNGDINNTWDSNEIVDAVSSEKFISNQFDLFNVSYSQ